MEKKCDACAGPLNGGKLLDDGKLMHKECKEAWESTKELNRNLTKLAIAAFMVIFTMYGWWIFMGLSFGLVAISWIYMAHDNNKKVLSATFKNNPKRLEGYGGWYVKRMIRKLEEEG